MKTSGLEPAKSPQLSMKKLARALVGERCRRGIVVRPIMSSDGVTLARIAVDCRVWFAGKGRLDLSLSSLGNELVLLSQMHEQRRTKILGLAQVLFGVRAVISDGGADVAARGGQERHQGAEAIALDGNLTRAIRQFGLSVQGVLNISDTSITIIGLIKAKAVLPVSLYGDAKVDARLLTPE
jgi:hypothetical protein